MKDSIQYQLATMPDENCTCDKCSKTIVTRKRRERDMKDLGLCQGETLLNPDETQMLDTSNVWQQHCLETDSRDANVTDRLPRQ